MRKRETGRQTDREGEKDEMVSAEEKAECYEEVRIVK